MKKAKRFMKKTLLSVLIVLLVLSLCSCNESPIVPSPHSDSIENTPPASTTAPTSKSSSHTLNGDPISEWTIAIDAYTRDGEAVAEVLVKLIASYTGERIKTVAASELMGTEKNLICLGAVGRKMDMLYPFSGDYYHSQTDDKGSVISMISTDDGWQTLVNLLKGELSEERNGEMVSLTLPEKEYIRFSIEDEIPAWNLKAETKTELFEGVTYVAQRFVDENGKPYCTFAMILDPDKVSIRMGTSNDGYELAPAASDRQTTLEHMKAAVANGQNVIAGVNANFFKINSDYSPNGLALKDGVLINGVGTTQPFFAVTEEGEYIIDDAATYRRYERRGTKFVQGFAGNAILLKNGLLTRVADGEGVHPRTLVGLSDDGKIIFGVVDGRQSDYSNGATYARCAIWMRSLGATTVLNLDGGGSSSFVLRTPETDHYDICNSPSDGSLRKIYNSVLVTLKDE